MEQRYTDYDPFAWTYNRHWGGHALRIFCPVLQVLLLPELRRNARVLDLCCGTGQLARWLTDQGYRVAGVDGSEAMLRFAEQNAPGASFTLADARAFHLPRTCDAAISMFDSLNHILVLEELAAVFRNVERTLTPGGIFLFDLNVRGGFRRTWETAGIVDGDHACISRTSYDDETRLTSWDMTIFRLLDQWERSDFRLIQRIYEKAEIRDALEDAAFSDISVFDSEHCPQGLASLPPGKAFFLARKRRRQGRNRSTGPGANVRLRRPR